MLAIAAVAGLVIGLTAGLMPAGDKGKWCPTFGRERDRLASQEVSGGAACSGGRREVAGAVLTVSTMGGYSVTHRSEYVGYLHASVGDQFNAYRRKANEMDEWLGKYRLDEGVKAILRACDRTAEVGGRDAA